MRNFITLCIDNLENISSLSYADLSNVNMFHYIILNNHTDITISFIRNVPGREFPGDAVVKNPPVNSGDMGLIPGLGRSYMLRSN